MSPEQTDNAAPSSARKQKSDEYQGSFSLIGFPQRDFAAPRHVMLFTMSQLACGYNWQLGIVRTHSCNTRGSGIF